jgi:hypothetical protein
MGPLVLKTTDTQELVSSSNDTYLQTEEVHYLEQ